MGLLDAPQVVPLLPQIAEAYKNDPRTALVHALLEQGQHVTETPTYNPGSTIAKALTMGLSALPSAMLANQYQDQNAAAIKAYQDAFSGPGGAMATAGGAGGVGGAAGPSMPPQYQAMSALGQHLLSNPATASQGIQVLSSLQQELLKNQLTISQTDAAAGRITDANGTVIERPGFGPTMEKQKYYEAHGGALGTYGPDVAKTLAGQGVSANPETGQPTGIIPQVAQAAGQKAGAEAQSQLGSKILENTASYALRPVAVTPTEQVQSGFSALPPSVQQAITRAVTNTVGGGPQQGAAGNPASLSAAPIKALMTPQQFEAEQTLGKDFGDRDKKAYDSANAALGDLTQMNNSIELLNQSGWSQTGTGANARLGAAKAANTLAGVFGMGTPFDPNQVANWEAFNKKTKIMGMDIINQHFGGSREAASIINGATSAVPNSENTYLGARLVSSGIEQQLQRERELYQYKANTLSSGKPLAAAETDFNQSHPVQQYTMRAIANAVPDQIANYLVQHPETAPDFDKTFGKGVSDIILKNQRTPLGSAGMTMPGQ